MKSKTRVAIGGSAIIALMLLGLPASSHTGNLDVTYTCNPETGNYDGVATLKIKNTSLDGSTYWKIGNSTFEGTPNSNAGLDRGPVASHGSGDPITLGTFTLPGTTTGLGPWVYGYTTWTDNFGKGSDGQSYDRLDGKCSITKLSVTPPIFTAGTCDAVGTVTAPDTADYTWLVSGTEDAKTYTAVPAKGITLKGQTVFGPYDLRKQPQGCYTPPPPTPVEPPIFTAGTCNAVGTVIAEDTESYTWEITGDDSAKAYTAVPNEGVTLSGQTVFGPYDLRKKTEGCTTPPPTCSENCNELPYTGVNSETTWLISITGLVIFILGAGIMIVAATKRRKI